VIQCLASVPCPANFHMAVLRLPASFGVAYPSSRGGACGQNDSP
jgi:hypothetical protein